MMRGFVLLGAALVVAADANTTLIVPGNMTEVSALITSAMKMIGTGKPS